MLKPHLAFICRALALGDVTEAAVDPKKSSLKRKQDDRTSALQGVCFRLLNCFLYLCHQQSGTTAAQV